MTAAAKDLANNACCERCGAAFHCGVNDATPCPCTGVALGRATLDELRANFGGCLCIQCLRELAARPLQGAASLSGQSPPTPSRR